MMNVVVSFVFLELLAIAAFNTNFCNGSVNVGCIETEREELLKFKQDLDDPSNRLASWTGDGDCCNWAAVVCHNFTGHVLELHLANPFNLYNSEAEFEAYTRSKLVGKINHSLLDFKHLSQLDLSGNDFQGIQIPQYLGFIENLRYLNLSNAGFSGRIPHQLGNLSNLQYLDLSNFLDGPSLYVENLSWLSTFSLLKHLDLSYANLSKATDWLLAVNSLPSLKVLKLSLCKLQHFPPLSCANFFFLTVLDLSRNFFDSTFIPNWVFGLRHLVFLDLSYNSFQGPIPYGIRNLPSLRHLDLSGNQFNFTIPNWIFMFSDLEYLSLSDNMLQGTISSGLANLTSLKTLDLSYNVLEGKIPTSFGRLCKLRSISLSYVNMSQELSEIFNVFSRCISDGLEELSLDSCQIFGHLTDQIGNFKNLKYFSLSDNLISGPVPLSLGKLSSLEFIDLSINKLTAYVSENHFANLSKLSYLWIFENLITFNVSLDWIPPFQVRWLWLDSCLHLGNRFPSWILSQKLLVSLDISNSRIQDTIPDRFWEFSSKLKFVNLSHNRINGKVPNLPKATSLYDLYLNSNNLSGPLPLMSSNEFKGIDLSNNSLSGSIFDLLCHGLKESNGLQILDLEDNLLSGEIPDCWMNIQSLKILNLGNNKFTGNLPPSLGTLSSLQSLNLQKNQLSGTIPESFKNCTELLTLILEDNKFFGNVPTWIGERFSGMLILSLRSNKFDGLFPAELCLLRSLQILDLAYNNLSGAVPTCISNFSAMVTMNYSAGSNINYTTNLTLYRYKEEALIVMKRNVVVYCSNLNLLRIIDLSKNNLSGEIPLDVTDLVSLMSLNLSHNHFSGRIPKTIGAIRLLEVIDFSSNQLSNEIPQSISSLSFLNHLNLSVNNLSGKIPTCTQLQSFDASSFMGNDLCGSPLSINCTWTLPMPEGEHGEGDGDKDEVDWFYVSLALGFVVAFWCVIGPLIVNRRWRYMYSLFLDRLGDKCCSLIRKF